MNSKKNVSSYGRFKDLPWFDPIAKSKIMVFGQGGIGSWVTLFLARAGADLVIVDMDIVDEGNLAGQLYGSAEVGMKKVAAMFDVVTRLCGENNVTPMNVEVKDDEKAQWYGLLARMDVVVVSFDNIPMRKLVYEKWRKNGKAESLFVDGRMSSENGNIFTISKTDPESAFEFYEGTFFEAGDVEPLPCSAKATSHCGAFIATIITASITNWFTNKLEAMPMKRTILQQFDFHLPLLFFESYGN